MDATQQPFNFGGKPGEPVPEVDPEDLKALWQQQQEVQAMHPGQHATGIDVMKAVCKPGANVKAVWYRMSMFGLLTMAAKEQTSPWIKGGEPLDVVFRIIANIPMEWIGHTPREGLPFDVEEFFRRLEAGTRPGVHE